MKEKELWILLLFGIRLFSKPLFFGQTFFFGDLFFYFLPEKKLIGSLLSAGQFPLWNPYLHGGQPFLANLNNSVLYPTSFLYVVLPPLTAFNLDIVFHLLFGSVCCFLLARAIGFRPVAALVAGLVFGYCGHTLSHANLFNRLLALPYVPLCLLLWHNALCTKATKWTILTCVAVSIQFLAGAPEISILTIGSLFLWPLLYSYEELPKKKALGGVVVVCVIVLGLTAIQTFPTAELVLQSPREKFNNYQVFTDFSLNPRRLPEMIFPGFLGDESNRSKFWGTNMEDNGSLFVCSIYFGLLLFFLAAYAGFKRQCSEVLPGPLRLVLFVIFLFSVFLSLGRFLPGFSLLFHLPVLHWFRYPIKFLTAGILPVSLLCAAAIQHQFAGKEPWKPSVRFLVISWILFLALCGGFVFLPNHAGFFFGQSSAEIQNGIRHSYFHAIAIFLLACLLYQLIRIRHLRWQGWLFAGLLAIDLLWAGLSVNPYIPRSLFSRDYPIVNLVKKQINDGRLYRPETPKVKLFTPSNDIGYGIQWDLSTLNWYTSTYFEIPLIFNRTFEALETSRLLDMRSRMSSLPWEKRLPFLSIGGVTLVLTSDPLKVPSLQPVSRIETSSELPFFLYQNGNALHRVSFYTSGAIVHTESQAFETLQNPGFDPQKYVVLENASAPESNCEQSSADIKKIQENSNSRIYDVQNACQGYLFVSEPYYKGWSVSVDEKRVPLVPANGAFFALLISPGNHRVSIRYLPDSFLIGAGISVLTLLLAPLLLLKRARRI